MKQFVILACLLISFGVSAQSLTMHLGNAQVTGSQVTYDLSVEDFTEIVAMQYSISYDSNVLSLVSIEDFIIPTMSFVNFDTTPGTIVSVWFESSLNGVTLVDNSVLYRLVFDIKSSGNGQVCFSQEPREPEILQGDETLLDLYVTDDCHDTPFLFHDEMTFVIDLFALAGVAVSNTAQSGGISINVQGSKKLDFILTDIQGKAVASFPEKIYNAGHHVLQPASAITPGVYFLVIQHQNKISSTRILFVD